MLGRASRAPIARWRVDAGAAIYVVAGADSLGAAPRGRAARSTRCRARVCWSGFVARRRPARGSCASDELIEATRDSLEARRARAARSSRARACGLDHPGRAVRRGGPLAPRDLADRRAQAPFAVGRADPRGRDGHRDGPAPTSAAAPPPRRSSPRRPLRRLARGPREARGATISRSCARTSRSTRTSSRGQGGRGGRGAAGGRRARRPRPRLTLLRPSRRPRPRRDRRGPQRRTS